MASTFDDVEPVSSSIQLIRASFTKPLPFYRLQKNQNQLRFLPMRLSRKSVRPERIRSSLDTETTRTVLRIFFIVLIDSIILHFLILARPAQVFCYLTSWSAKRPGAGKFEPANIDPKLCTHLVYAFATLKDHKLTEANEDDPENYDKLVEIRNNNPDINVNSFLHTDSRFCTMFFSTDFTGYWRMGFWINSIQRANLKCVPNEPVRLRSYRFSARV